MPRHLKQFCKQTLALFLIAGIVFQNAAVATAQSFNVDDFNALRQQSTRTNNDPLTQSTSAEQPQQSVQFTEKKSREKEHLRQKPSIIEQDYATQLQGKIENKRLPRQFGYDFLGQPTENSSTRPQGVVSDAYTLGIDDALIVVLRGSVSRSYETRINRDGKVVLPDLAPLSAAGISLGDFKTQLDDVIRKTLPNTQGFVSLAQVRSIQVLVAGNVANAGMKTLTSTNTVLDALIAAEGVRKDGSLRHIKLMRGTKTTLIDLYGVLLGNASETSDLSLQDGDRLVVPPVGGTVAIVGDVKQAGIFELPANTNAINLNNALGYAGGTLRARANRYITLNLQENGKQVVNTAAKGILRPNDILLVQRTNQQQQGVVTLAGHVQNAGQRSLAAVTSLRELLGDSKSLQPNAYLLFAALFRQQENSTDRKIVPVNLQNILNGFEDVLLQDQDQLVVLSRDDINYLWSADVQAILQEKLPPSLDIALSRAVGDATLMQPNTGVMATAPTTKTILPLFPQLPAEKTSQSSVAGDIDSFAEQIAAENKPKTQNSFLARGYANYNVVQTPICKGLQELQYIIKTQGSDRFVSAKQVPSNPIKSEGSIVPMLENYGECPAIFDQYGDVLPVLLDNITVLTGEVNKPGIYPVANIVTLDTLLQAAGGLSSKADKNSVRLTQLTLDPLSGEEKANPITVALDDSHTKLNVRVGDYVHVSQRISERSIGVVELSGQFRRPGVYDVREKETLSSVIARAGGLSTEAYPYGAVFTRISIRKQEKENFERLASQLETSLLTSLDKISADGNPQLILEATQRLIQSLRNTEPLGRMVIEADPDILAVTPQEDILLEAGDRLFMPKRPFFVMVSGDVLSAGARQFEPQNTAEDYIELAGGLKSSAAEDQIFLVLPNGNARPLSLSAWNYKEENIPPGSAIVVPTEPVNSSFFSSIRDASQVLGQVALTGASIAVIGR